MIGGKVRLKKNGAGENGLDSRYPDSRLRIDPQSEQERRNAYSYGAFFGWAIGVKKNRYSILALFLVVLLGVVLLAASYTIHTPFAAWRRSELFFVLLFIDIGLLVVGSWLNRFSRLGGFTALFALFAFLLLLGREVRFQSEKRTVLHANSMLLEQLGSHFIVGYHNKEELVQWVRLRAIGGVYITRRNLRQHSVSDFARFLDKLQKIRKRQGLVPLVVAADQEGGLVAHLTPPLPKRPALAQVLRECRSQDRGHDENEDSGIQDALSSACQDAFRDHGQSQGQDLRDLGVNLDFAPVVDLKHDQEMRFDLYSQISARAITKQPQIVAAAAAHYCAGLAYRGVGCTAKHFPGLGLNKQDAHFFLGSLDVSRSTLENSEWVPFRHLMRFEALPLAVMVSHIELPCIEPDIASSRSEPLLKDILRKGWEYQGLLISDDFSMFPVSEGEGGIGSATLDALRHGMDFVLISYDSDLFYRAMSAMFDAIAAGTLTIDELDASKARIRLFFDRLAQAYQKSDLTPPGLEKS